MDISQRMLALIATADWEGTVLHTYRDSAGVWTIGVGHKILRGEDFPRGINLPKALDLLRHDMQMTVDCINHLVKVYLTQSQFDALCALVFNIGTNGFASSTVLRMINGLRFDLVPQSFRMWNKVTIDGKHVVDDGLVNRREKEIKVWGGDYS